MMRTGQSGRGCRKDKHGPMPLPVCDNDERLKQSGDAHDARRRSTACPDCVGRVSDESTGPVARVGDENRVTLLFIAGIRNGGEAMVLKYRVCSQAKAFTRWKATIREPQSKGVVGEELRLGDLVAAEAKPGVDE